MSIRSRASSVKVEQPMADRYESLKPADAQPRPALLRFVMLWAMRAVRAGAGLEQKGVIKV